MLKIKYTKFESCKTGTRPYISERGPRNSGPMAYARTFYQISRVSKAEDLTAYEDRQDQLRFDFIGDVEFRCDC